VRPVRNSAAYQDFLQLEEQANPDGTIYVITDNISSHDSKSTRAWLEGHPRIRHAFIPKGACWLNLQEGWWRIFRRQALAEARRSQQAFAARRSLLSTAPDFLTPGRAGVSVHVPVDGYKEDRPPKPRAWLRDAVAIGGSDDSPRVHERLGSRRRL
jgi:DDE superfamily endonuclease